MWLIDVSRQDDVGALPDRLAATFALERSEAEALMRAAAPEFAWHLEQHTLSRGGLADLIEALDARDRVAYLGEVNVFSDAVARADGEAILAQFLGSKDASRALAARIASRGGLAPSLARKALPHLAALSMANLELRARRTLADLLAQVPPLGHLSRGSPQADLAAILRRRCGAGTYSPRALARAARRALARAGGFPDAGIVVWYARFVAGRRTARYVRAITARRRARRAALLAPHR